MSRERTRDESLLGTEAIMVALDSDNHMVSGTIALDASNPTPIVTGLTSIESCGLTLSGSAAPGVGTTTLTYVISVGTVNAYAWKPTSSSNPTLIASTGTETIAWWAKGKK